MNQTNPAYKQDDRHDWIGDVAESYVSYCFACEGFEVFGAGKWTADVVVRDPKTDHWWRIEVKSTDRKTRKPRHPSLATLARKADLLAKVFVHEQSIGFRLVRLTPDEIRGVECEIRKEGDIRAFLSSKPSMQRPSRGSMKTNMRKPISPQSEPNFQTPEAAMAAYDYLVKAGQIQPVESREAVLEYFKKRFQGEGGDTKTSS